MTPAGRPGPAPRAGGTAREPRRPLRVRTLLVGLAIRALAQSARRSGVDAASVDLFGDRDHRRALPVLSLRAEGMDGYSAEALVRLGRRVRAEEVAFGADLENHPGLVERLAEGRRLLGNPPSVLREVRDPFAWTAVLADTGLPAPAVRRHDAPPVDAPPGAWLRKPLRGGGGGGVGPWRPGEAVAGGEFLQRRIRGVPASVAFLADGRSARVLAVSEMLVGRGAFGAEGFSYCGSLLELGAEDPPLPPRHRAHEVPVEDVRALAGRLTAGFGLRGLNGIDGVLSGGRFWPVEVNPRWTASMELLEPGPLPLRPLPGASLFELHRRACRDRRLPAGGTGAARLRRRWSAAGGTPGTEGVAATGPAVVGKALLRAPADARVPDLEALDGVLAADVPEAGARVEAGGPVCTLLAVGADRAGCLARLEAAASRVREALAPGAG